MGNVIICVYCSKELEGRKKKYCNDHCRYRFKSMNDDKVKKFSVAQHLRISRAGRKQRQGKIGVRFN